MNKEDATLAFVDMLHPLDASHRVRAWPEQDGTGGEPPWEGRGGPSLRVETSPGALCLKGHTSLHMGHITGLVLMETGGLTVTQAKQNQKIVLQSQ